MFTTSQDSHSTANRAARQPWSVDRKVDLVLQGLLGRRPVTELCREAGVSSTCYYQWRQKFIHAAQAGLACPEAERCKLEERIRQLEAENASLQQRVRVLQDLCLAD